MTPVPVRLLLLFLSLSVTSHGAAPDYLREVKPLLKHKCFACHGGLKQKAGLRLDTVAHMRQGGRGGPVIVPGDVGASRLIQKIRETDPDQRMPQEASPLTRSEIELLSRWIAGGAEASSDDAEQMDPRQHWSYQPVRRPEVPRLPGSVEGNEIDAFLNLEHERLGLKRAPTASKAVLLRRLFLDLIGLPPSPTELKTFVNDRTANAYAKVVDRLLDDPRYGERWGRHWMDVWRYSDWYGRRGVNEIRYSMRHIWRWRDWIVQALNSDKGYDQMIIEMLAGDEVAPKDDGALAATGFIGRNWYKFDRNVWMFDVVERTSQGLLGLTLRCARCHDHKYDPITQEDYYRFRAFFEPHGIRTDPVDAKQDTVKDNRKTPVLKYGRSRVFDKELDAPTYLFRRGDERSPDKSKPLLPAVPVALTRSPVEIRSVSLPPQAFYPALHPRMIENGRSLAAEKIRSAEAATRTAKAGRAALRNRIADIRAGRAALPVGSEKFLSDSFASERPELWKRLNGNWVYEAGRLSQSQVTSFATQVTKTNHPPNFRMKMRYRPLTPGHYRSVGFSFDFEDKGQSQDVYTSTGDARQSVQAFHRTKGKPVYPREGIVPVKLKVGEVATIEAEVRGRQLKIWLNGEEKLDYRLPTPRRPGKFALWVHSGAAEFHDLEIISLEKSIADLEQEHAQLKRHIEVKQKEESIAVAELKSFLTRVTAEQAKYSDGPGTNELYRSAALAGARVRVLKAERDQLIGKDVKETKAPGADSDVEYEPLGVMYPAKSTGRRTALARWIASPDNPRTARVAVNHIWLRHFGTALVASVANFGLAGKAPTHPELLDWLAGELVGNDWSMKHLHRVMLTSAAYQRSTAPVGAGDNRDYTRMNSQRMDAEVVRDSLLHLAGQLDATMGGEDIDDQEGNASPRRSLYFRVTPDSQMKLTSAFDAANPNACYRREESIVPHQSLALFNGGLALDRGRQLAGDLTVQCRSDNGLFVHSAWLRILSRDPTARETKLMLTFLDDQVRILAEGDTLATFAKGGESTVPPSKDPRQRARENLVLTLFNHNDFITIR